MKWAKNQSWLSIVLKTLNILSALALLISYLSTNVSPERLPWIHLFGMSFPIWMSLNLLFIALWLLRRKAFIFLSVISVAIGYQHLSNFIQLSFSSSPEVKENSFKMLSYNVKNFGLYEWEQNEAIRDSIRTQLQKIDADIMCFQEFYFTENSNGFQTKSLLKKDFVGINFHEKYTHELIHHQYFGVTIATKFPIINKGYIEFENDRNNFCIYADLLINKDTVRLFNNHLASIRFSNQEHEIMRRLKSKFWTVEYPELKKILNRLNNAALKRAPQIRKVMKQVEKSPYPVILAGDFNDTPSSFAYVQARKILKDSFVEAGNGIGNTYIGAFPSFRIDYIMHDNHFEAHKYKTHPEVFSDHHAIHAILELKSSIE